MTKITQRIDDFVEVAFDLKSAADYRSWNRRLLAFLDAALGAETATTVNKLGGGEAAFYWEEYRDSQVGHLEGLAISLASEDSTADNLIPLTSAPSQRTPFNNKRVFLVHGHDVSAKEATARFLEKLNLSPIILHEQTNEGQTVIEKFEAHTDVGYAVVLLTPDDVGASAATPDKLVGRARQNVVLELGYFTGKLGRRRVCGLFRPGVEIPSDFHGVLFIELDSQGGWKTKLAQELVGVGMQIDLQGLLRS